MQLLIFIAICGFLILMYSILCVLSEIRTNLYKINDTLTGIDDTLIIISKSIVNKEFRGGINVNKK